MQVYVKSPAIEFRLPPENDLHVVEEYCHQACYDYIREAYGIYAQTFPEEYDVVEGFTLTNGAFVDRYKAYWVAERSGMLVNIYRGSDVTKTRLESYMMERFGNPHDK